MWSQGQRCSLGSERHAFLFSAEEAAALSEQAPPRLLSFWRRLGATQTLLVAENLKVAEPAFSQTASPQLAPGDIPGSQKDREMLGADFLDGPEACNTSVTVAGAGPHRGMSGTTVCRRGSCPVGSESRRCHGMTGTVSAGTSLAQPPTTAGRPELATRMALWALPACGAEAGPLFQPSHLCL